MAGNGPLSLGGLETGGQEPERGSQSIGPDESQAANDMNGGDAPGADMKWEESKH